MEIKVMTGDIEQIEAGAIVLGIFEGQTVLNGQLASINKALGGEIGRLIKEGGIKGKLNELTVFYTLGKLAAERVIIVGLGKQPELTQDKIREATATVCRYMRQRWIDSAASALFGFRNGGLTAIGTAQSITEGAILGTYEFRRHKTEASEKYEIRDLTLVAPGDSSAAAATEGYRRGKVLADAAITCRDMVNEPSNFKNPTSMAQRATEIARDNGLDANVLNKQEMIKLGMGGLLGVAQGSTQPPKFIIMNYRGRTTKSEIDLAIVGKGITFDSGGISIKPSKNMGEMKMDMAGGASAMFAIAAISQLKPKINVTALIPATENMPSGNAFHPGDVLTAMNGKTMEIMTTDAEGRLILADALSYAVSIKAKNIVDIATLTGAIIVGLGDDMTGAFSNNDALLNQVLKAGNESGEPAWRMPMGPKYRELIKSDVADIKNSGGKAAGAITAAEFLKEFVGETPWVHLDVAGTAWAEKEAGYLSKGATGVPVRTLVNLALMMAGK